MSQALHATPLHAALRACLGALGLVFGYSCGYNLLLLAAPIYLLQIYDRVLSSRSADTLIMLTIIVAATVVVGGLLDALRRVVLGRIGAWLDDRTRPFVLAASLDHAARGDAARATEAYRDLTTVSQFVESNACPILFDFLWSPFFIGVLFLLHPLLGFAGTACVLLVFGLAVLGEIATGNALAGAGTRLARSYGRLNVAAANIQLIRAMGATEGAAAEILSEAQEAKREQDRARRRGEIVMLLVKPVRALSQIVVMGLAAWLVLDQGKSPAIIFAASLLFGRGIAPIEGVTAGWKAFSATMAAYRRVAQALLTSSPDDSRASTQPEAPDGPLLVENMSLSLPGASSPLLKSISLRLEPGECLGIIGLSGSGKSMLGKVIAGLAVPTLGQVRLGATDVRALQGTVAARHLGYMPQEIELVGRSVADIIGRLGGATRDEVIAAAKIAGLHETIMRLPNGYESDVADGEFILLRAHRQRLGLARALCGSPRLIVLDEPNASLDYLGERMLFEAVETMKAKKAIVIVITHRTGILATTDKIAIMQDGAVSACGSRDDIFARYLGRPQVEAPEHGPPQIAPQSSSGGVRSAKARLRSATRRSQSQPTA